jgi:hypothetical protein
MNRTIVNDTAMVYATATAAVRARLLVRRSCSAPLAIHCAHRSSDLLARYGEKRAPDRCLPTLSQGTLADMVGATRSRLNLSLDRFRNLGFIRPGAGLRINSSLLSVVLHE